MPDCWDLRKRCEVVKGGTFSISERLLRHHVSPAEPTPPAKASLLPTFGRLDQRHDLRPFRQSAFPERCLRFGFQTCFQLEPLF